MALRNVTRKAMMGILVLLVIAAAVIAGFMRRENFEIIPAGDTGTRLTGVSVGFSGHAGVDKDSKPVNLSHTALAGKTAADLRKYRIVMPNEKDAFSYPVLNFKYTITVERGSAKSVQVVNFESAYIAHTVKMFLSGPDPTNGNRINIYVDRTINGVITQRLQSLTGWQTNGRTGIDLVRVDDVKNQTIREGWVVDNKKEGGRDRVELTPKAIAALGKKVKTLASERRDENGDA